MSSEPNSQHHSLRHIVQSLVVNILIAICKFAAAFFTGSGAMLAEAIHSAADCTNQLLLLLGVLRAKKPATPQHPLGFGRALYFWSFVVALLLFTGGGVFSIYEGIHKLSHPEPLENLWVAFLVLFFSLVLEGYATVSNVREINQRRKSSGFVRYLIDTKDSDLVVIFGENSAASLGLLFALGSLAIAAVTGDSSWDAMGSLMIGIILVGVALFLAVEVKSLLMGERATPEIDGFIRRYAEQDPEITRLLHLVTLQQGPGQVLVMMKLGFNEDLTFGGVADAINRTEAALRKEFPEVRWCFIEPDRPRTA